MRFLRILLIISCLGFSLPSGDIIYVHVRGLGSKNLNEFQQKADTWNGVHYLGYCHNLSVAKFSIDRKAVKSDSIFSNLVSGAGYDCIIKSSLTEELFQQECNQFEPRN